MEHQMNGKDQAALTACIPQSLAGGIFIYKADEGETLLYASDYVIGFFGCASYEELADYVHHSFRGMVDLRDRELVEQNIRQQTASDVCQTSYARYRVIACDGTVRYAEHFSRKVTLPGVGEVYYVFIADYDRKYLTSDIDNMTGLPGNRRFLQYVRDLMESGQFLSGYCLVYFNVINFKLVNIRYGVAVGDDCLKGLATMIRETFPQGFLSRRRNDHFQLLTPEGSVREKLETLHESICQVYRKYQLEIKAGVYHFPENQVVDPALAVDYAKIACQHIRDEVGVSVLEYTQDLQKLITVNNYIAGHCDDAIEHGWIQVYYQPVIRTLTGAVCGMEALARWNDPVVGFLSPARFIPILEKNHDIYKLDCYILRQTCQALRRRLDQQLPVVPVSFNLSRLDFFLCDIFQVVEDTVRTYGLPRDLIHLEITETMLVHDKEVIKEALGRFLQAGYQILMDDFGSGYSSLNVLKDYDFNIIKLDTHFLSSSTDKARSIIGNTVDMIKEIGSQSLAEGVETQKHVDFLASVGCEKLQGYFFSKPMLWNDLFSYLEGQYRSFEDAASRAYYEKTSAAIRRTHQSLALVEYDGQAFHHVYLNQAYRDQLASFGRITALSAELRINRPGTRLYAHFRDLMEGLKQSGHLETIFQSEKGYYVQLTAELVASMPSCWMLTVSLYNLTLDEHIQEQEALNVHIHELYRLYDVIYLIDLDKSAGIPLFSRHAVAGELMEKCLFMRQFLQYYARSYIHPDDCQRFLDFTDYTALKRKLSQGDQSDCFRFRQKGADAGYTWKEVTYIAVPRSGRKLALACVRPALCCPACQLHKGGTLS